MNALEFAATLDATIMGFAKSDLRRVRKCKRLAVTQTKRGTLWLDYADGVYTLAVSGGEILVKGSAGATAKMLVTLYDVVKS